MTHKRTARKPAGFTVIEIVLILAVLAAAGAAAYIAYNRLQDHATVAPSATPKPAEKTYTLKFEKLSFTYPTTFALADDSKAATSDDDFAPGRDKVSLTKPNGFRLTIQSGASVRSGLCEGCTVQKTESVTLLGLPYSLNYVAIEGRSVTNSAFVASDASAFFPAPIPGKFITETAENTKLPWVITTGYYRNGQVVEKSLTEFQTDMADAKKVIESLKYD